MNNYQKTIHPKILTKEQYKMKNILILCGLAVILIANGCNNHHHEMEEETTFCAINPLQKDTLVNREYVCQIRSIQHIEIMSLEKGYIQKVMVDEGQSVKKGALLFQILPLVYQAEKEKAQAEVNFAQIEYQNTKKLADSNIVSETELFLAKARLDKVKSELALAIAHLHFTEIRAPFDGIIGRFNEIRTGSLVEEGELLTTLSDNSKMWVYFNVPEAEYLDLSENATVNSLPEVSLQLANRSIFSEKGKVETILADFNNENGNIAFRATFPNPDGLLRHGETGNVLMPIYLKNALLIPQQSTFEILDKRYVYVIGPDNIVETRHITIGQELPHLYCVTKGIQDNDKILVEGLRKVKNKQKIKIKLIGNEEVISDLGQLHAE